MNYQPRPVKAEWTLYVRGELAFAEIWTHPLGWELRITWVGELHRSQAYRDIRDALTDAGETKVRLEGYNRSTGRDGQRQP